ncbi:HlyD family secretion protein [Cesiribacter andamanensis]|uniref:Multidrug resistance protein MdtN n=1 Tax=Cesiribacter andamanensis AMV16 TaxID=1279009 RepID=M7MXG8_9BACT|nr:HlyD family efflux transporter periplasmic adaptor subunit [Cesiribacter andamanensis]EMR01138.1 multidrug resistance protein MdtN [Cesiribacter andamanensis AMV16]
MLNISNQDNELNITQEQYSSLRRLKRQEGRSMAPRLLTFMLIAFLAVLFLPWTQNVQGDGVVTTPLPSQRPQAVPAVIDGRIAQWFVREGEQVQQGDTLLLLSEIKEEYLDPQLVERTQDQFQAKRSSVGAYEQKVAQLENQIRALEETRVLKLQQVRNYIQQARLKVQSDSMEVVAARTNLEIADQQYARMEQLFEQGLKSRKDLEDRRLKQQEAQAKIIKAETDLLSSQNKLLAEMAELASQQAQYEEKIAKARSDQAEARSGGLTATADAAKLQNQVANYTLRQGMYYVTAPQAGYITKTIKAGLGETVKSGDQLLTIMPSDFDLAAELYIEPLDLPLLKTGQPVRLIFDGWPSIVFSGWPNAQYGTFGGRIIAIDNVTSENGRYRILVGPDPQLYDWPDALRIGSGARGMALLGDVPLGYELWRRINGFPPNFYQRKGSLTADQAANEPKK